MKVRILAANRNDIRELSALDLVLSLGLKLLRPKPQRSHFKLVNNLSDVSRRGFEKQLRSKRALVLKAVEGGKIIGFVCAELREHSPRYARNKHVYVSAIYVSPAYRCKGVARKLFEAVFAWAKRHRVSEVSLKTETQNKRSQSFYGALGFQPYFIELKKFV